MLEIILLIFLTRRIGNIAVQKGLPAGRWKLFAVLAWIAGEIAGVVIGMIALGAENYSWVFTGLAGAFGGYFVVRAVLLKKPDVLSDDDLNNFGQN